MSQVNIRMIQHYFYCRHRLWLIEVEKVWEENVFVVKANIDHKAVHSGKHRYSSKQQFALSDVRVFSDELDLVGVVDCIEFDQNENGIYIDKHPGKYELTIVEYKPTAPKNSDYRYEDLMQLFAQKCAVDEVFHCNANSEFYYANTKKRIKVDLSEHLGEYREQLILAIEDIKALLSSDKAPKVEYGSKCNGCSLADICLPKAKKLGITIRELSLQFNDVKGEVL